MGKFAYLVYSAVVISIMSTFSYSPSWSSSNPNSYYHGSGFSGGGYYGGGSGGGHK
jgi:hypothetical protein